MEVPHLLALKVMRLSRPALAQSQPPLVAQPLAGSTADPSFQRQVLATAVDDPNRLSSIATDSSGAALLRDAALSPLFTLPAAFGTICLGETFAATLNLSNETRDKVSGAKLTVEMQSSSSKQLIEVKSPPGDEQALLSEQAMELGVDWEIKELGMHVLVCTVDYGAALGARSFQKFYKFNVSPPLSIKTRVHLPMAINAQLSANERDKVFLEVHVQNTSPASVTFDRLVLEPAEGLRCQAADDVPMPFDSKGTEAQRQTVFESPFRSLLPHDTRQYLFILEPTGTPIANPVPGSIVPLGRLDITWRSSPFAEKGRLLTSTLNRRIPGIAVSPTAGLKPLPPHTQLARVAGGEGRASPLPPPLPPKEGALRRNRTCAICVVSYPRDGARVEDFVQVRVQVTIRRRRGNSADSNMGHLGLQYVPFVATRRAHLQGPPTPLTESRPLPTPSPRPFSPPATPSRPMTPVTTQLRLASSSTMTTTQSPKDDDSPVTNVTFPPQARQNLVATSDAQAGFISLLGPTVSRLQTPVFDSAMQETQSDADETWEQASLETDLRFVGRSAGLVQLGGVRVLEAGTAAWSEGDVIAEAQSLGCLWIHA